VTMKKKRTGGNPARTSPSPRANLELLAVQIAPLLDSIKAGNASTQAWKSVSRVIGLTTDASAISQAWDVLHEKAFSVEADAEGVSEFINVLLRNRATPFQVLFELDGFVKHHVDASSYNSFWHNSEQRWAAMTSPGPVQARGEWNVRSGQAGDACDRLAVMVAKTRQEHFIVTAWIFALEHLADPAPSKMPALVAAFQANPVTPAAVKVDALIFKIDA